MKPNALKNNLLFLKSVRRRLAVRRIPSADVEAEQIVRHFGRMERLDFFTGDKSLSSSAKKAVERALRIRRSGMPLSYILKKASFYGQDFFVSKHTLIPRPETEILVDEAIKIVDNNRIPKPTILDLGTGSGCIAVCLTIARPHCRMTALDFSKEALKSARKNIQFHGLEKKIKLIKSDFFASLTGSFQGFWDVIVSNPPYIDSGDLLALPREVRAEPRIALDGGPKGLTALSRILTEAPRYLKPAGWLLLEMGAGQDRTLKKLMEGQRIYRQFYFVKDLNGIQRILAAQNG